MYIKERSTRSDTFFKTWLKVFSHRRASGQRLMTPSWTGTLMSLKAVTSQCCCDAISGTFNPETNREIKHRGMRECFIIVVSKQVCRLVSSNRCINETGYCVIISTTCGYNKYWIGLKYRTFLHEGVKTWELENWLPHSTSFYVCHWRWKILTTRSEYYRNIRYAMCLRGWEKYLPRISFGQWILRWVHCGPDYAK